MNNRLACLALISAGLLACDPEDPEVGESSTSDATTTEADTESDPTTGVPQTDTDASPDTDTDDAPETDTDGENDTDTDGDTDGGSIDPACESPDPDADTSFALALDGWDGTDFEDGYTVYSVDDECLISSVEVSEIGWVTQLDCSDEETTRTATVTVAGVDGQAPDWAEGEAVHLRGRSDTSEFGGFEHFELTRDGDLLTEGLRGTDIEVGLETLLTRLEAAVSYEECGAPLPDDVDADVGKLALSFEQGDASLVLISGHRGELPTDSDAALHIDVVRAESGHCCHGFHELDVLKRRTVTAK